MQTAGDFQVAVSPERAFAFLRDPHRLAGCIPGCSELREIGPETYAATLSNRVGPIAIAFDVTVALIKVEAPSELDATVSGNARGLGGRLTAAVAVRLEPAAGEGTHVRYNVDLTLSGRLGGIGQPVFHAKSDELSKKFGANVRAALEAGAAPAGA